MPELIKKKSRSSEGKSMTPITDILVKAADPYSDRQPDIVRVTIISEGQTIDPYNAYAVRGMSLADFMMNEEEREKALVATQGRFMFANGNDQLEDKLLAHSINSYAIRVQQEHAKDKQREHGQKSGETRRQTSDEHYESLRTVYNEILLEDTNPTNYLIAKRLNERGYLTVNHKEWRNTNVQALRDYIEGKSADSQRGNSR